MVALTSLRGFNYWSRRSVICMELAVGAFEDISSADVPDLTQLLVAAMPGLVEHQCSVGTRGGFISRLRRGTYAPHIVEHVALELQVMIGHDTSYGRTRGGDIRGSYTVAFEYAHEQVGLRAAALALEAVQRAFAGTLTTVQPSVWELTALAQTPSAPPIHQDVFCGITGGGARAEAQHELAARFASPGQGAPLIIDVSPAYLLHAGLPYSSSELAIILDAAPTDVPVRYQETERAQRLVGVLVDAVQHGGVVICPASARELQEHVLAQNLRVAIFSVDDGLVARGDRHAVAAACVRDGHVRITHGDEVQDAGVLYQGTPATAQLAATLAAHVLRIS